ncbi:MAG: hypothetical protein HN377_08440 [Alphaproteobacteria bacterium]|jgi:hypothetical protein|nr:hypothetical protein [Alphaproteobacteria bacterium]
MTAEIVDLDAYRALKKRLQEQTASAPIETENDISAVEPVRAHLEELRKKDSIEPV